MRYFEVDVINGTFDIDYRTVKDLHYRDGERGYIVTDDDVEVRENWTELTNEEFLLKIST